MPEDAGLNAAPIYFSTKLAEEVGFEKFARRQAKLQGIFIIVLDRMRIRYAGSPDEDSAIVDTCTNVTELDIGGNLLESLDEALSVPLLIPKLNRLILNGNRFSRIDVGEDLAKLPKVLTLGLSETLLEWSEISLLTQRFPGLKDLAAERNGFHTLTTESFPPTLHTLSLATNAFTNLTGLGDLSLCKGLEVLQLKQNSISTITSNDEALQDPTTLPIISPTIHTLDFSYNDIASWRFLDHLPHFFPALKHLRVTGNPLYTDLQTLTTDGKLQPAAPEDGFMLTVARLPQLVSLNHSTITPQERLNAETYYLSQIGRELARVPGGDDAAADRIKRSHPRYEALCKEYGAPMVATQPAIDPNSVGARLVSLTFVPTPEVRAAFARRRKTQEAKTDPSEDLSSWTEEIPKSQHIYFLLGHVARKIGVPLFELRLVWLTGERDPRGREAGANAVAGGGVLEWWDSSEDEEDEGKGAGGDSEEDFVEREEELVPGNRPLGTYIEGREARIRVELRPGSVYDEVIKNNGT